MKPNKKEKKYLRAEWKKYRDSYPEPKAEWHLFYNRMYVLKKTKEYCIQPVLPWTNMDDRYEKMKQTIANKKLKEYTNHKIEKERRYNPEYYKIDITYPLIEERINIYQWYKRQISQIEDKLYNADSLTDGEVIRERQRQLDQLNTELEHFKLLNPLTK